jgi:predicted amidohydrolase YtcJ
MEEFSSIRYVPLPMPRVFASAAALLLSTSMSLSATRSAWNPPDVIFHHGKIITVDGESRVAESVAIAGDRFYAVGSNTEMEALAGPDTRRIDLRGHAVVPGLIDNHNHQYHVALLLRGVDLQGVGSLAELLDRVRRAAVTAPAGETIFTTTGWNPNDFPEKRPPTRSELDGISADRPIVVYASRGRAHVNTAALRALGFTGDTALVAKVTAGRNAAGEPDGVLSGSPANVLNLTARIVAPPTLAEQKSLIAKVQAQQHAMGLTGIRDLQIHPDVMRAYFELWREHALTMRVSAGLELNAGEEDRLEQMLAQWGVGPGFGDEWLRLDGIAEYNPGEQLREPFSDREGADVGELRLPEHQFREAILTMNRYGWRPAIHITGDRTLDLVLDAYEAADRQRSIRDRRWVVEHIPLVHRDQMQRMKRLGVVVSAQFQPYADAENMFKRWGPARTERAVPMREMLDEGLMVSGGSDWPGAPNNPFLNIYFYVTRKTLQRGTIGAKQKITRDEALRVETINNAYLTFEERLKGSIEPGKLADLVILSDDVLTVPEEKIRDVRALATWVGGRQVYSRPGGGF